MTEWKGFMEDIRQLCERWGIDTETDDEQEPRFGKWILCSERLPEVSYDAYGNWCSEDVLLLMDNEGFTDITNGTFNPAGVFEEWTHDGPLWVGKPVRDVIAWMPYPAFSWGGGDDD